MQLRDEHGRTYTVDTRTDTVGILMGEARGSVYMRPVHGGPEWTPPANCLRPATEAEVRAATR